MSCCTCTPEKWMRVWIPGKGLVLKCFTCGVERPLEDYKHA